jgi:8-oxo-(d)GTP phosphatase
VLPDLLRRLAGLAEGRAERMLRRLAEANLDKGELLACTVAGTGGRSRVVAVTRHRPPNP